jgi:hypothetical protein
MLFARLAQLVVFDDVKLLIVISPLSKLYHFVYVDEIICILLSEI